MATVLDRQAREGPEPQRIDHFFSMPSARADRWRDLTAIARSWTGGSGERANVAAALEAVEPLEEFHAFPGARIMALLRERLDETSAASFAELARRISTAIVTRSYKHARHPDAEDDERDGERRLADTVPGLVSATLGREEARRPYFEMLVVAPHAPTMVGQIAKEFRRLRRPEDQFIYEVVPVGSFEDAIVAAVINPDIAAVTIYEGFAHASRHQAPVLRALLDATGFADAKVSDADRAWALAEALKRVRPELDIFLLSDRKVEAMAGAVGAAFVRRVLYSVEELLELHLSVMEGINARFRTPFFDNLKKYAMRPISTFHALPIARGKSVFKSDWIRDMGEFYGLNLLLAESSATTGGLDSLLEPTGNIKEAQAMAARAFGADHCFFVTNGTSTSNKMVQQAIVAPGDIVILDRNCHKSHHYGLVLAGGQ